MHGNQTHLNGRVSRLVPAVDDAHAAPVGVPQRVQTSEQLRAERVGVAENVEQTTVVVSGVIVIVTSYEE